MSLNTKKTTSVQINNDADLEQWPYAVLKRFRLIFKAVQQHSQWVEAHCGVTSAQLWAMWELSQNSGLKVTELAQAMAIHHSTASNMLDKLAKKGLIIRERVSHDQRVVTVTLTEAGCNLMGLAPSPPKGILQQSLFQLPETVLKSLAKDLDMLVDCMDIKDQSASMQPLDPLPKWTKAVKK